MADDSKLRLARAFAASVPHNRALGIDIVDFDHATVLFRLPYDAKLIGHPDTGTLHGGAITAFFGCRFMSTSRTCGSWPRPTRVGIDSSV